MAQVKEAYRKDLETQLTDVQRQVADLTERRIATLDDLERVVLRAPEAGTIVELSIHTVGGVAAPGQKLMDIVPVGSKLVVEVMIPPQLIDSVTLGQFADLHFAAFDQTIVPTVEGKLVYVGADRQTDPRTDVSYFVGRVNLTETGLTQLAGQKLRPGMPAEVVIKTGERSLVSYLLKPLLARMHTGMTER
jgi:HlyD family type I secretion membrane fusion protein